MIDSIVLVLDTSRYYIHDPDMFTPTARWVLAKHSNHKRGIISKQNPTKEHLLSRTYKPRLTLSNRMNFFGRREPMLKIELSSPKFFFGNNFEELQYKDFVPLAQRLATTLKDMGVTVDIHNLIHAPVSAVHYSKNLPLTDGSTPYHYIAKTKQTNMISALDTSHTEYRDEGYCYKWHCNSYEIVFYDKIKDLQAAIKSSKRTLVETDNALQLNLFKPLQRRKKLEMLRMEVRLNKRQKIKHLFKKIGVTPDLTFKKLFKPAISKKVLLHYLDELEQKRPVLLDYKSLNDKAMLAELIFHNPDHSPKQIVQIFDIKKTLDVLNLKELRTMLGTHNKRSWYRLMADVRTITLPRRQSQLTIIRKHIERYKPLTLPHIKKQSLSQRRKRRKLLYESYFNCSSQH